MLSISHWWWSLPWASHTDDEALPEHLTLMMKPSLSISHWQWSLTGASHTDNEALPEHLTLTMKPYRSISHWQWSLTGASHTDNEALPEHLWLTPKSHLSGIPQVIVGLGLLQLLTAVDMRPLVPPVSLQCVLRPFVGPWVKSSHGRCHILACAVSTHWHQPEHQGCIQCYVLHSYSGTIFSYDKLFA